MELSGHYYYADLHYTDNAPRTLVELINIVSTQDKPLSELLQPFERYPTSGEINLKVNDRNKTLAELSEQYKDGHVGHLDGLSVDYPDWWFNVRSSHTEPLIRINIGASSQELLKDRQQALLGEIASINEGLNHKITTKADVTNAKAV